jgi:predicted nucleic acid-binding protein
MIYFDSSALLPLFVEDQRSSEMEKIALSDPSLVVWWGTSTECLSGFARLRREKIISSKQEQEIRGQLLAFRASWTEIQPGSEVKQIAQQLLLVHPLSAADCLQLAAALLWADKLPTDHRFVCLDSKLADAALKEGFIVLP